MHNIFRLTMAAGLVFGFVSQGQAEEIWRYHRSKHFEVFSEAEPNRTEALLRDLEDFHSCLEVLTGAEAAKGSLPLTLYVVPEHSRLKDLLGFTPTDSGSYGVLPSGGMAYIEIGETKSPTTRSGRHAVFHEYVHHFIQATAAEHVPNWLHEGFAEYLATFRTNGMVAEIGYPALHRFQALAGSWVPTGLVFAESAGLERSPFVTAHTAAYYAQAWLYTHMIRSDPQLISALNGYLQNLNSGMAREMAFRKNFDMTEEEFGLRARAYWRAKAFPVQRLDGCLAGGRAGLDPVRQLDDTEAILMKAQLRMRISAGQPLDKKMERFLKTMLMDPATADAARIHFAEPAVVAGQFDQAQEWLNQMEPTAMDSRSARMLRVHLLVAREAARQQAALDETYGQDSLSVEDFNPDEAPLVVDQAAILAAQQLASTVIADNPRDSEAYYRLVEAALLNGDKNNTVGVEAARALKRLLPQSTEGALYQARLLYLQRDYEAATPLLRGIVDWGESDWYVQRARRMLGHIQNGGVRPAAQ